MAALDIVPAQPTEWRFIQDIAYATWPTTFAGILTPQQITYMLEWMYSESSLREQIQERGHHFLLAYQVGRPVGFCSYELDYQEQPITKLHKIYLLPSVQGQGVGRALLDAVVRAARTAHQQCLSLNVNRHNRSVGFYEHYGLRVVDHEDIDIGGGYFMNDFVMAMSL